MGFKIDYEEQDDSINFLPKIRHISHLYESWLLDNSKFFIWQQFITFLYKHLMQTYHLEPFYFNLLDKMSKKLHTQNAKRVILEGYLSILDFEGHFTYPLICTSCHNVIETKVSFIKELKAFHSHCINHNKVFKIKELEDFLMLKNSFFISDKAVDDLFNIIF